MNSVAKDALRTRMFLIRLLIKAGQWDDIPSQLERFKREREHYKALCLVQ